MVSIDDQDNGKQSPNQGAKIENSPVVEQPKGTTEQSTEAKNSSAANIIDKSPSLPYLKIRERVFVNEITNPNSECYDHRGKAYAKAFGRELDGTASVQGSRLINKPKIRSWIDDILQKHGADVEVRVATLSDIALNRTAPRKIKRQALTKEGDIIDLVDEHEPSHADRIKAVHVLNKLSGVYDTQRHNDKLAEITYRELCKRTFKDRLDAKDKRKSTQRDVTGDAEAKTGRGD